MKNKEKLDLAIAIINAIFIRLGHFLQNSIDFIYIASYLVYVYSRWLSMPLQPLDVLSILMLVIFSHFIYSITYIINDYINYGDDLSIKALDPEKYSFYMYRPIQYFGKAVTIVLLLIYTIYVSLFWRFINILTINSLIEIVTLFAFLSILESTSKKWSVKKKTVFSFQLVVKYFVFALLLSKFFGLTLSLDALVSIIACVIPYTFYRSSQDKLKSVLLKRVRDIGSRSRNIIFIVTITVVIIAVSMVIMFTQPNINLLLLYIVEAHLVVSMPFLFLTIVIPLKLLGVNDKNIYSLYRRLGVKLSVSILILSFVMLLASV